MSRAKKKRMLEIGPDNLQRMPAKKKKKKIQLGGF